jgi:hypothetical protein
VQCSRCRVQLSEHDVWRLVCLLVRRKVEGLLTPKPVLPPLTQLRAAAASAVVLAADSCRLRSMAVRTLTSVLQSP